MRPRRSIILLAALAGTVLAAPAASADSISATTSLTGAPDPVTTGHTAALTTTFANGSSPAHNVEVRVTFFDAGFVDAILSSGVCTLEHAHQVECEFGAVAGGVEVSAIIFVTVLSVPGSLD